VACTRTSVGVVAPGSTTTVAFMRDGLISQKIS
jgi:hypothetical protein